MNEAIAAIGTLLVIAVVLVVGFWVWPLILGMYLGSPMLGVIGVILWWILLSR